MAPQAQTAVKGSVRLGNYLRRLRNGYGYSLRRVEERAKAEGGELDNSQLSRYEKGICYPSFDKLRVLASVFNVSIQAFSDVVDLESFEELKPETGSPRSLVAEGHEAVRDGDMGRAFAYFERAIELLLDAPNGTPDREEMLAKARISLATAMRRLGKLALAEQELRNALRGSERLAAAARAQALLNLANVHADQGDLFLAEMEAERAHDLAVAGDFDPIAAQAMHTLASILAQRGEPGLAVERYHEASALYSRCGNEHERSRLRINIGGCYVAMGKVREGIRILRGAQREARDQGRRRLEAQAWSYLGEAYYNHGDHAHAKECLRQSEVLANSGNEPYPDLLFVNAFYDWKMARDSNNPTREKIAFGRLKALRSSLERRFPETDAFDAHVERRRSDA